MKQEDKIKVVIIGGVAGGATALGRLRRLSEIADITLYEKGAYVSFANCGLPYYVGNVIEDRSALFVSTKAAIIARYNVTIRDLTEVTQILPEEKRIVAVDLLTGDRFEDTYDKLLISTGSRPCVPETEGLDAPNVFTLTTVPDTDRITDYMDSHDLQKAVVVGGGFIGLEMAENLAYQGMDVTLVELADQVMAPLDPDMAKIVANHLVDQGIDLRLGTCLKALQNEGKKVLLDDGTSLETDMVVLSLGVRPNSDLAREAGLEVNERGYIVTDDEMRTSDPDIYAVGDVTEIRDFVTGGRTSVALAGPANKQGRIAADNMLGESLAYPGSMGTSIAKVFDLTVASVGLNEKALQDMGKVFGKDYFVTLIHPASHAGYYPGSQMMDMKVIADAKDQRIIGAQIVGPDGVDKRIDLLASTIHYQGTIRDLTELELAYAPPFGSAKDPVNFAGYTLEDQVTGLVEVCKPEDILSLSENSLLLDVRTPEETEQAVIPGAQILCLSDLRDQINTLDQTKDYIVYCRSGLRSYLACRILKQNGFKCKNMMGGYISYEQMIRPLGGGQA